MTIGEQLQLFLESNQMTRVELGNMVNVREATISSWVYDQEKISDKSMEKLARVGFKLNNYVQTARDRIIKENTIIGKYIKFLRLEKQMSRKEVSDITKISNTTLYKIENGYYDIYSHNETRKRLLLEFPDAKDLIENINNYNENNFYDAKDNLDSDDTDYLTRKINIYIIKNNLHYKDIATLLNTSTTCISSWMIHRVQVSFHYLKALLDNGIISNISYINLLKKIRIGILIRRTREEHEISREQFSENIGISKERLFRIEQGIEGIVHNTELKDKIINALGIESITNALENYYNKQIEKELKKEKIERELKEKELEETIMKILG